ncbi:hypothetical protein AMEX_G27831 [Astyanax mexicanus]|uniref:Uncharacterized protein n=1 Tax=Astyanax mexicanus TaxID=7994 RepID=A0A8T2KJM5_ASTMX|nr:hypothetical protein AMEX_G27831 [Astyanax mexicanus]
MSRCARDLLLELLKDLDSDQFDRFTDILTYSGLEPPVRRGEVEGRGRGDITCLLIERFTEKRALEITLQILRDIRANQTARHMEEDCTDLVHPVLQSQTESPNNPQTPPPEVPPTSPPNPNSALIHCSQQFKGELLKEKGNEIYHVLDKGVRKRLALLINNVEFDRENMRRKGAQKDEENMEKLLRALDYHVIKHSNLSGREMDEAIRSFAGRSEHAKSDSTFVVIMSHGQRDKILGIHHGPDNPDDFLPVDNIFTHLNTANCPALLNKPKVILIQACRGGDEAV